ncbi:hypothetical protein FDB98_06685 [Clostridium botulinum]|nr:hypothetical protein [Clostridium botulinum]
MSEEYKVYLKRWVIDVLIVDGLFLILKLLWDWLEVIFDGGIQESISDSIIACILVTLLWWNIRKWVNIKDKTYSD